MRLARISELRNQLSRYLDHVRAGGRVVILDRNRPVAEIVPVGTVGKHRTETEGARLDALQREGLLRRGTGRIPPEAVRGVGPGKAAHVLDALLDERERGR
jgi:prevent-host-death family protein